MDVIGWLSLGVLAALIVGAQVWSHFDDRRRARRIRAWAASNGLVEIPCAAAGTEFGTTLRRATALPAFQTVDTDRQIQVIPLRTRIKWGYLWALSVTPYDGAPVFAVRWLDSGLWRRFGRPPKTWVRATIDDPAFARYFWADLPRDGVVEDALPAAARRILIAAQRHLFSWVVRADGIAVLMVRESYGRPPAEWLAPGLAALRALVAPQALG